MTFETDSKDAARSPALPRPRIGMSLGQPAWTALVIMAKTT